MIDRNPIFVLTGTYTTYYPDNVTKKCVSTYNASQQLSGPVVFYHQTGDRMITGTYVNGNRDSMFTFYDIGEVRIAELRFVNNKPDWIKFYHESNQTVMAYYKFDNNTSYYVFNGEYMEYTSNSNLIRSGTYINNTLSGRQINNYFNSSLKMFDIIYKTVPSVTPPVDPAINPKVDITYVGNGGKINGQDIVNELGVESTDGKYTISNYPVTKDGHTFKSYVRSETGEEVVAGDKINLVPVSSEVPPPVGDYNLSVVKGTILNYSVYNKNNQIRDYIEKTTDGTALFKAIQYIYSSITSGQINYTYLNNQINLEKVY